MKQDLRAWIGDRRSECRQPSLIHRRILRDNRPFAPPKSGLTVPKRRSGKRAPIAGTDYWFPAGDAETAACRDTPALISGVRARLVEKLGRKFGTRFPERAGLHAELRVAGVHHGGAFGCSCAVAQRFFGAGLTRLSRTTRCRYPSFHGSTLEFVIEANLKRAGRPPGPRMPCGWCCGAQLACSEMRKHFTACRRRPKRRQWMKWAQCRCCAAGYESPFR